MSEYESVRLINNILTITCSGVWLAGGRVALMFAGMQRQQCQQLARRHRLLVKSNTLSNDLTTGRASEVFCFDSWINLSHQLGSWPKVDKLSHLDLA